MSDFGEYICDVCGRGFPYIELLEKHVRKNHAGPRARGAKGGNTVGTIGSMKKERGMGGPPMLHGSDLPDKVDRVTIVCAELREPPAKFKSLGIIDLEKPLYEKESWAVNSTNLSILAVKFGVMEENDDLNAVDFADVAEAVKGKKITLQKVYVNDPSKNKSVPSLQVV